LGRDSTLIARTFKFSGKNTAAEFNTSFFKKLAQTNKERFICRMKKAASFGGFSFLRHYP